MLKCKICQSVLNKTDKGFSCPICKKEYPSIDGIFCFSEIYNKDSFSEDFFKILYEVENNNFWFRVRNLIIGNLIQKYLPLESKIIEVGCGTGFVTSYLKKLGYDIDCADLYLKGLKYCKIRDAANTYYQFDIYDKLLYDHYDGICAFDVIEHIDNDDIVLNNMKNALKDGGFIFITVPANKRLWSKNDVYSMHKRRYNLSELKEKIGKEFKNNKNQLFYDVSFSIYIYITPFNK